MGYAVKGLRVLVVTQPNFRIHIVAVVLTCLLAAYLKFTKTDWLILFLIQTIVLVTEAINTAIEFLVDKVSPEYEVKAGIIKDVSAGAVLIVAIGAMVVGSVLFGSYIVNVL
jgi:undecaprenol kinase/diacylglycerol kinase (ATP)